MVIDGEPMKLIAPDWGKLTAGPIESLSHRAVHLTESFI
jgi:hypothetical protein